MTTSWSDGIEGRDGLLAVGGGGDLMAARAQHVRQHGEEPLVVVHQEHARRPLRMDGLGDLLRGRDDLEPARVQPQPHRGALALAALDPEAARRGAPRCRPPRARPAPAPRPAPSARPASARGAAPPACRRRCPTPRGPPSPTPRWRPRITRAPPWGMAVTALRMRWTRASRSSKALPSTGGMAPSSWVTVITTPRRCASSRQRGAVISSASATTAGSPTGPKPTCGSRETNSWKRRTETEASMATSRMTLQPPLRGLASGPPSAGARYRRGWRRASC